MELHPAQSQILSDTHRFRFLVCGRKFGKTTLGSEEITDCSIAPKAWHNKPRRILYIAPTLDDARRLMWDRLNNQLRGAIQKSNDTRLELKVKTCDKFTADIFLGSWEKVQNYRGDEFDLIVPDEIQDYRNFWVGWNEALLPTLTPRKGSILGMGTPKGFNHLYDLFNFESKDQAYKSFHFTSYDNPFTPKEEIDSAKLRLTEDQFAQEYLADFRKTEGLVYKEFNRTKHLFKDGWESIRTNAYFSGLDFGFTNPTANHAIKKDFDNHYWVNNEYYQTGKTEEEVSEYIAGCGYHYVYPDPESPSGIAALRKRGVSIREVIKGKDSIRMGINRIRELFKQGRLHIHESCQNLVYELETYSYPDKKDQRNDEENPIKENDHALDALRYALSMNVEQRTEAIQFRPQIKNYNNLNQLSPLIK